MTRWSGRTPEGRPRDDDDDIEPVECPECGGEAVWKRRIYVCLDCGKRCSSDHG
jgi:DNA-directed RNA polymerase subunit RPC12/RpoP